MIKKDLIKNPVLRAKMLEKFENPAGDLSQEIQEQDLNNQVGGTVWTVVTVPIASAVSNLIVTQAAKCGYVYTASAECNSSGNSCH